MSPLLSKFAPLILMRPQLKTDRNVLRRRECVEAAHTHEADVANAPERVETGNAMLRVSSGECGRRVQQSAGRRHEDRDLARILTLTGDRRSEEAQSTWWSNPDEGADVEERAPKIECMAHVFGGNEEPVIIARSNLPAPCKALQIREEWMRGFDAPMIPERILLSVCGKYVRQGTELEIGELHAIAIAKTRIVSPVADEVDAVAAQVRAADSRRCQERTRRGNGGTDDN